MENIKNWFVGIFNKLKNWWKSFEAKNPKLSQWVREGGLFLIISNAITIVRGLAQGWLTSLFAALGVSTLTWGWPDVTFSLFGKDINFMIFGSAGSETGDGNFGLAAVIGLWVASFVFEVINFFMQRKFTFRSNGNLAFQGSIYFLAWVFGMLVVNSVFSILNGVLVGLLPAAIINVLLSFLQGTIFVVVMFFINKIIFTDAPKTEEQPVEEKTEA